MAHARTLAAALGALLALVPAYSQTTLQLSSASIVDGKILLPHACRSQGGRDQSVQLSVKGIPAEARYLSIVVDDPDAVVVAGKVWVHWNLFNVPVAGDLDVAAGAPPAGDAGRSTGGSKAYEGMCPPNGFHGYRFAVFATRDKVETGGFIGPSAMTIEDFASKFGMAIVARSQISGKF